MTLRTTLLAAVCTAALLPGAAATAQTTPSAPGTLAGYGYGETALRGTYGSAEVFVPLAPGLRPSGEATVELVFDHSPLLRPRSTLTVLAGGVAVGSTRLTPENARAGRLTARVPASLVGANGVALSLRGYLRLTDDDCEESDNPAQWVTVRPASRVVLATEEAPRDLSEVAGLLTGAPRATTVEVAVPGAPEPEVLQAAGVAAAQVGRWQGEQGRDALVVPSATAPRVVVAPGTRTPAQAPARWTGSGYTAGTRTVSGERGVLALGQTGTPQLLVGGATPEAVRDAARALTRPALVSTLKGPLAALTGEPVSRVDRRSLPWQEGAATLAQLGVGRLDVVGVGQREVSVQVDRPGGWEVERGARLDLVVEASSALRAQTSTLQVSLVGNDLGTRRLQPGSGPTTYSFTVPPGLVDRRLDGRPLRALDLVVRFDLDVPRERCSSVDPSVARASVLPTSAFRLPHGTYDGRELARFPHPLADDDGRVTVVLPRDPDSATVRAGLQMSAAVGRWSDPGALPPELVTVGDLTGRQRAGGLVLLGAADAQLGEEVDLGRTTVEPRPGEATALLGLVESPLDDGQTALVVHGDAAGLLLAARTLGARSGLASLRGDHAALVGTALPATLSTAVGEEPPAALAPVVGGPWYMQVRPYTVPALVLLAGLLVVLGLLARARWRPRRRP